MPALKLFLTAAALLVASGGLVIDENRPSAADPHTIYIQRSDRVQARYRALADRIEEYYASLLDRLSEEAPDLLPLVEGPRALQHGYQILPNIIGAEPPVDPRARSASYSWSWTERLIDGGLRKIAGLQRELRAAAALNLAARATAYEKLARGFAQMRARQNNIDAHVQYNRLWQEAIAVDRSGYDRQTFLHDAVVERQAILDALKAPGFGAVEETLAGFNAAPAGLHGAKKALFERAKILERKIHTAVEAAQAPPFVRLERNGSRASILHVPFYTDIEDVDFVRWAKETIERIWRVRDGRDDFAVELRVSYIAADRLYGDRTPPRKGESIGTLQHLALFPPGAAVLTTGAMTTHVQGRAIILGPHDLSPEVLAHEFGHILGFRDGYFRGYRDMGAGGFRIMEIVSDPNDIMAAPLSGGIFRSHFERILKRLES
jgi:hypothetical protein